MNPTLNFFNIYAWQTKSLIDRSTGICTQNDPYCNPAIAKSAPQSEIKSLGSAKQTITASEAYDICQTYINAYLSRSKGKENIRLKNVAKDVINGCTEDVIFTGVPEVSIILNNIFHINLIFY